MSAQAVTHDVIDLTATHDVIDLRTRTRTEGQGSIATGVRRPVVIDLTDQALLAAAPSSVGTRTTYARFVKPVGDRVMALVLLMCVLPVLLTVALGIRLKMGPRVLFRQTRIGFDGRPFTMYKFRTMIPDRRKACCSVDGADRRLEHKVVDDPRLTSTGRFLRRWSLDELPQLVNVLRGEMSLVGPRPELPEIVARYAHWEHGRHSVRPGLTGFWQTRARGMGPTHKFTDLDLAYVRELSLWTDLRVLAATLPAALGKHKGW